MGNMSGNSQLAELLVDCLGSEVLIGRSLVENASPMWQPVREAEWCGPHPAFRVGPGRRARLTQQHAGTSFFLFVSQFRRAAHQVGGWQHRLGPLEHHAEDGLHLLATALGWLPNDEPFDTPSCGFRSRMLPMHSLMMLSMIRRYSTTVVASTCPSAAYRGSNESPRPARSASRHRRGRRTWRLGRQVPASVSAQLRFAWRR